MKKIVSETSLVVFLFALTTTSCEKNKSSEELLTGKWEIQLLHIVSYVDNVFLGDSTVYYDPGDSWIELNSNKTGHVLVKDQQNDYLTWSVKGDLLTIVFTTGAKNTIHCTFSVSETQAAWYCEMNAGPYQPNPSKLYKELWYTWCEKL